MSRMINNLNNVQQRMSKSKYTMALENTQSEVGGEQQEFPNLAEEQSPDRSAILTGNDFPGESSAGQVFSVRNSPGILAIGLGIFLALTLSIKAFSVVHSDKNQTVKLAQIVAKQNREIKNLEGMMTSLQTERKGELDRISKDLKFLDKQVAKNDKDFSEMVSDANMTRSTIEEMKTTQKQMLGKIVDINEDVELIKKRP